MAPNNCSVAVIYIPSIFKEIIIRYFYMIIIRRKYAKFLR